MLSNKVRQFRNLPGDFLLNPVMILKAGQVAFATYQNIRPADDIQVPCRKVIQG